MRLGGGVESYDISDPVEGADWMASGWLKGAPVDKFWLQLAITL